jgi:signal transduction histidine kinase
MNEYSNPPVDVDYRTLFEALPGLYLILKKDLTVVAASKAYLDATMTRLEDMVGRTIREIFPDNPDDPVVNGSRNVTESQQRVVATRRTDTMPVQKYDIARPDGTYEVRYWSPMHVPVLDASGDVAYIIHRVEDVTEFIQLKQRAAEASDEAAGAMTKLEADIYMRGQEVSEANRKLREIDRLRTNFFANVSHELRTPLTLILGPVARMLAAAGPGDPNRRGLETVERNAKLLLKQVNDLLDIAKLEAGQLDLDYAKVDMAQFVRLLAANFEGLAHDHRIALNVHAPETLLVEMDEEKVERVILNLLSNAFKFTPAAGSIDIAVERDGEGVVLRVADSGPGIPPASRDKVFERFQQLEDTGKTGGTGLGLSIVKEFVMLHGGGVHVETSALGGAAFVVRLPLTAPQGAEVAEQRLTAKREPSLVFLAELRDRMTDTLPEEKRTPHGGLVLIIDDNGDMREHLTGILAPNHRIETAANGFDGLNKIKELLPDLVISDVMMPVMTGEEMARRMLDDVSIRDIPLLMLTAKMDDTLKVAMLRDGVRDYLAKPFSADELAAKAARLIAERRRILAESAIMLDKLAKSNQDLQRFAYAMAHDLKSPLRSIHNLAGWIDEDSADILGEHSKEHLARLRQQARRMEKLLDDMLEYSTIGLGAEARTPELADGASIVGNAVELVAPGSGFDVRLDERLGSVVLERMPLQQIFANLIQNAVQHHDQPAGVVEIGVAENDTDYVFSIRDDGPGIPAEFHQDIFEMFRTLKPRFANGGSGMGLALARKLAESQKGNVTVESAPGEGACFRVTWPKKTFSGAIENGVHYA